MKRNRGMLNCFCGAVFLPASVTAQVISTNLPATPTNGIALPPVTVSANPPATVGTTESASQGTTSSSQLEERPILRVGEVLETVPGVIITQHAGGGKANQYFLRGFNLDHGTDFAIYLDDMPLNLPSHAHGEGYADMNSVIEEFVQRVDYEKGPYYADVGNYGSAGAAHLIFYKELPADFITTEAGTFGYARGAFGMTEKTGFGTITFGGEAYHDDGPWLRPDDYSKFNGIMTYSLGDDANGASVTGGLYHGQWNSSDQIPESAIPLVGYLGTLNPTDGGNSDRFSLQAEWHRQDENSSTKLTAYGFYYDLDLFSDFTYYLTDPTLGDQFEQQDRRWVGGLDLRQTYYNELFGREVENSFGIQSRNDWINNGLYQTFDRNRVNKFDVNSGSVLPATTEADRFTDTEAGVYAENKIQWSEKFHSVAAMRGDLDCFDVNSLVTPSNSGTSTTLLPSPKLSLIAGPWEKTEVYAQGGFGFHSNDGRGATQNVEPVSAINPYPNTPSSKIPGLIQTQGAEVGVRTLAVSHLQSTVSLWYLYSRSELQQDGDTGGTVASLQPSDRYGVEWANLYSPIKNLTFDFDLAESTARYTATDAADAAPGSVGGTRVPEAVGAVASAGVTLRDVHGFFATLRLRYFGPRDLTSDGEYTSQATLLFNAAVGYQITKPWRLYIEFLNLTDSRDHDIDYAYTSRITSTSPATFNDVFHPVEPFQVRVGMTCQF